MNQVNIKADNIRSVSIVAIPSETITGKEFKHSNIFWIKTRDGGDYDILFDQRGEPIVDAGLVKRVADYYGKNFQAVIYDGKAAYAQVNENPEKAGAMQTAATPRRGSGYRFKSNVL